MNAPDSKTIADSSTGSVQVIWWAGLALCAIQLLKQIADGSLREFYFISDHLYIATLFEDLTRWSGTITEWRLTPSPYFFPDMPLYAAARSLGVSIEWSQYCSGIGLMLLIIAAARWLITLALPLRSDASAWVAPMFALWIALHADRMISLVAELAVISCHGGAVAASFVSLGLCFVTSKHERAASWLLCALAIALGASDPLYAVSCSLPLLTLAARPAWWRRVSNAVPLASQTMARGRCLKGAASGIAGVLLARSLNASSTAGYVQPRPAHATAAMMQMISDLTGPARIEFALMTAMLALAIYLTMRLPRDASTAGLRTLANFQIASLLCTVAASILTGRYSGMGTQRYLLVPFTFGVVLATAACIHALGARALLDATTRRFAAVSVVTILTAYLLHSWPTLADGQYTSDVRKQAACVSEIDSVGADAIVLTDYWNAKPLRLMSNGHVHAVQMTESLNAPRWWINSRAWYRAARHFGVVVTNGLNPDAIIAIYGAPARIEHCEKLRLFIYQGDAQARLTESMLSKFERFLTASP